MDYTPGIHLIPDNEPERLAALNRYHLLDTSPESAFDNIAKLATEIFDVPTALISLVDRDRVFFKSNIGMGTTKNADRGKSLCSLTILKPEITVFEDVSKNDLVKSQLTDTENLGRFYAGAPIITHDGFTIGTLCIIDREPRTFDKDKQALLTSLTKIVLDQIEVRSTSALDIHKQQLITKEYEEKDRQLATVNKELASSNQRLITGNIQLEANYQILHESKDELLQLNRALAESESRFRNLVQQAPVAIAILKGHEMLFDAVNDKMLKLLGKSASIIGKLYNEALPEIDDQPFFRLLLEVYDTGKTYIGTEEKATLEHEGVLVDGYYDYVYQPVKNDTGNILAIIVVAINVTEQVEAREREQDLYEELAATNEELLSGNEELATTIEELRQSQLELRLVNDRLTKSEANFKSLIYQAPVSICNLRGRELIIEAANDSILKSWGKSIEVIDKPLHIALPELEGQPFLQILDDVYTTGQAFHGNEVKAILDYGGVLTDIYFNFIYQPIKDKLGDTNSIMIVATDVTELVISKLEREQAESNFRMLADNITQLAWMADDSGSVFWYNKRWYEYTNTNMEEMRGLGWQKVHHPDYVKPVTEKFKNHVERGEIWEDTFPLKGHDGKFRWFLSRATPVKDSIGKVIRWFGTNTDITEQRQIEQMKDEFMAVASHELKTPLTTLNATLQLLNRMKDNPSPQVLPRLIDQSNKSMERILVLIDDLLNVNRLSEGQLHLKKTTFTMSEMLTGCCNHIRMAGKHKLVLEGDKNLKIFADEHRIDQVVVNFVNNAVKYAPDSINIYLIVEKVSNMVKVSVKDNGPGIATDKIPHLFGRYFRADYSGIQYSGLGLGLYICSEIIKKHGGEIGVDSELEKGSSFWFTLPL